MILEMQGGKKGLLVNSTDICKHNQQGDLPPHRPKRQGLRHRTADQGQGLRGQEEQEEEVGMGARDKSRACQTVEGTEQGKDVPGRERLVPSPSSLAFTTVRNQLGAKPPEGELPK